MSPRYPGMSSPSLPAWLEREQVWGRQAEEILQRLLHRLETTPPAVAAEALEAGNVCEAVAELTGFCIQQAPVSGTSTEYAAWDRLLVELAELGAQVFDHDVGLLMRRLADADRALAELRECTSSNDLLDRVCGTLVRSCGFTRTVLSRVDAGLWRPWMGHFPEGDETWFSQWVDREIPLDGMVVESRILRARLPELVTDTGTAEVYRPIIVDTGRSLSYAVAPVVVNDVVIGFLHADYHPTTRQVNEVDRDVLWAFAQGFAQVYERAVLRERLVEQRERVREALAASDAFLAQDRSGVELNPTASSSVDAGPSAPPALEGTTPRGLDQLTSREKQVLGLVAVGATNAQIAERLVVAESTVKTHVKHILRKLEVTNRAQAISQYLSQED